MGTASSVVLALFGLFPPAAFAAPLSLSTAPAGVAHKLPAPNVIVSVDDSGSMGAAGMSTLRAALNEAFSRDNLNDNEIRLAWQSMHRCQGIPSSSTDCGGNNSLKVFGGQHRTHFDAWVATLTHAGGTPSHRMVRNAGDYLKKQDLGAQSPWASEPGSKELPILSCRRAYHLFMTDGAWNGSGTTTADVIDADHSTTGYKSSELGGGNFDGTGRTLGDGATTYDPTSPQTRIYRDTWGYASGDGLSTLSDLAFYYWATDLQPGIANELTPIVKHKGSQTFGSDAKAATVQEFWNTRNDPATWQHLTTYTIGFGDGASKWSGSPIWQDDTHAGSDHTRLITGEISWPSPLCGSNANTLCDGSTLYGTRDNERRTELWHMAINGRGKFVPAPTASALTSAFKDILNEIVTDKSTPINTLGTDGASTRTASQVFAAGYAAATWSGHVRAFALTNNAAAMASEPRWDAAKELDKPTVTAAGRQILSHKTEADGTRQGIPWTWDALSSIQKTQLQANSSEERGQQRLAHLRGERANEGDALRVRASRLGDIVNSRLWYTPSRPASGYTQDGYNIFRADLNRASRPNMVYVGANDGMLHAFDAANGSERFAYVPEGLHAKLADLTRVDYQHQYYVDGSPLTGDLYLTPNGGGSGNGGTWRTYLAGFLGAGGKGYFVIDVTDPTTVSAQSVILDTTASDDPDLGHIFSEPAIDPLYAGVAQQITRLNNGRWALVMGNGYNSAHEKPVLLIQYLDGQRELLKIAPTVDAVDGNGLSTPRLLDLNGDRKVDVIYAGDLAGRLWKFDLTAADATQWKVAFNGAAMFSATAPDNSPQAVTSAPAWQSHPKGGLMVMFGTGRNITDADGGSRQVQTVYGIHDTSQNAASATTGRVTLSGGSAVTGGRTALQAQAFSAQSTATTVSGNKMWALGNLDVPADKHGWYVDLTLNAGERVLSNISGYQGMLMDVSTEVPATRATTLTESCTPEASVTRRFMLTLNAVNGGAPLSPLYAYATDGAPTTTALAPSYIETGLRTGLRRTGVPTSSGGSASGEQCIAAPGKQCDSRNGLATLQLRASWRQVQ